MCVSVSCTLRHVLFFATPWMVARQAPLSMEFSRQEYWTLLPFTPPGDLPDPGIKPASSASPALQAEPLPLSHPKRNRLIDIENRFVVAKGEERQGRDGVEVWD